MIFTHEGTSTQEYRIVECCIKDKKKNQYCFLYHVSELYLYNKVNKVFLVVSRLVCILCVSFLQLGYKSTVLRNSIATVKKKRISANFIRVRGNNVRVGITVVT